MSTDSIQRPKDLRPEILAGRWVAEYYSEPAHPLLRGAWSYVCLVESRDGPDPTGAGAAIHRHRGLVQTLSFSGEEMRQLRQSLEAIVLPAMTGGSMAIDGNHGCVCIYSLGCHMVLNWAGAVPEEWEPVLEWIRALQGMIEEKSFSDGFED